MKRAVSRAIIFTIPAACASVAEPPSAADDSGVGRTADPIAMTLEHSGAVIAKLEFRDERVVIVSTGQGVRFTVTDARGKLLSREINAAELGQRHPFVHDVIQSSYANTGAGLDARLDPTLLERSHTAD